MESLMTLMAQRTLMGWVAGDVGLVVGSEVTAGCCVDA
jgi:hypothetical protein